LIFLGKLFPIEDLKVRILRNETRNPFVTSDDPAVQVNRFYSQRLGPRYRAAGLANAGLMFFLPLSPRHVLVRYDGDVYTCPVGEHISSDQDVFAVNTLQFVKAHQNVFFADWADAEKISEQLQRASPGRPMEWHRVHYAVRDGAANQEGHTRYRVVHTESERRGAKNALIHLENLVLNPGIWCSKIKFRHKPIFQYRTGSGYVRRSHEAHES
jgi:hypothetical protein